MTKPRRWGPGSVIKVKDRELELIDRAPKGWWALDKTTRTYVNVRRSREEWVTHEG